MPSEKCITGSSGAHSKGVLDFFFFNDIMIVRFFFLVKKIPKQIVLVNIKSHIIFLPENS